MTRTSNERSHAAWQVLIDRYAKHADTIDHAQSLAWLVLEQHCIYEWCGDCGGPSEAMVRTAEQLTGEVITTAYAAQLAIEELS